MTKYITVKLTEDQANFLKDMLDASAGSNQTWLTSTYGPEKHWLKSRKEDIEKRLAFCRRILTKLAKAKAEAIS